jgi:hypothetical protein
MSSMRLKTTYRLMCSIRTPDIKQAGFDNLAVLGQVDRRQPWAGDPEGVRRAAPNNPSAGTNTQRS